MYQYDKHTGSLYDVANKALQDGIQYEQPTRLFRHESDNQRTPIACYLDRLGAVSIYDIATQAERRTLQMVAIEYGVGSLA